MPTRPRLLCVLYANPDLYPPTFNALSLLVPHFDVHVVGRKSDRESRLWPRGVRLDRVGPSLSQEEAAARPAHAKLGEYGAFVWAVKRALARLSPSVVLAYDPHALVALRGAGCRAPIVYQRHEVEELGPSADRSPAGFIFAQARRASRDVPVVVFPEAERARYYQRHVALRGEVLVVPNFPLRSTLPEPDLASLLPQRAAARHVFYRGAIGPANGIREGIQAMPFVDSSIALRLAGPMSAAFEAELRGLVAGLGLTSRVTFEGFVPFDELNRRTLPASVGLMLYQAVSTNWSNIASANNKLYEYAACGVPAIVPDRPDFRSFLGSETWLRFVDATDPRAIARAIADILADPDRYAAMCHAARAAFDARFHYEAVFEPMLARIRALAGA